MIILYYAVEIAQRIKGLAKEKEITIKDMLIEIKLNKNSINTLSNGSMIQCDSLAKIADYLDCSVDFLLGRTPQKKYSIDVSTLSLNEQTMLNTFCQLSVSQQQSALDYLRYLLTQSVDDSILIKTIEQSTSTDIVSTAARNGTSKTLPHLHNNDENLESAISKPFSQE